MTQINVRTLVLLAMICITTCYAEAKRKEKDRKREKEKFTLNVNLCNIEDNAAPMHCFCDTAGPGNASDAKCWIFTGLTRDHSLWSLFSSQSKIHDLTITVRPGGQFTFVPTKGLKHLRYLQTLEIKYASITDIHQYAFANLTSLKEISVSRNQIVNLNRHAFAHLPNLTEITMDENRISELNRDVFVDLPSLQKLFIDQNNLSVIHDGAFRHLASLLELELDSNYISVITRESFTGLSGLKRLDLTSNRISMLGDLTFAELWSLEALLLDSNQIEMISDRAFAGLTQLKRLSLNENRIQMLNGGLLDAVPAITFLDLRSNELQTLTYENVRPILHNLYNETSFFLLEKNKFICDCRLSWMHNLRNGTKNEQVRNALEELTCYLEHPDGVKLVTSPTTMTTPPKAIRQPFTSTEYEDEDLTRDDIDPLMYDQQQDSNSLPVTQPEDPFIKHLFQIPMEELPCPQSLHGPTETTSRIEMTPADVPFFVTYNSASGRQRIFAVPLLFLSFTLYLLRFT